MLNNFIKFDTGGKPPTKPRYDWRKKQRKDAVNVWPFTKSGFPTQWPNVYP